jgi:hypothetical protein
MRKTKTYTDDDLPELISLRRAARRAGLSIELVQRLPASEFPEWTWVGGRRFVGRRKFERWLAAKCGTASAA